MVGVSHIIQLILFVAAVGVGNWKYRKIEHHHFSCAVLVHIGNKSESRIYELLTLTRYRSLKDSQGNELKRDCGLMREQISLFLSVTK